VGAPKVGLPQRALAFSQRPDFAELVESYRIEDAKRTAGKIESGAADATGTAGAGSGKAEADQSLESQTIALQLQLAQAARVEALDERVRALEESRAVNLMDRLRNSRN
jgi:hypothetical protein